MAFTVKYITEFITNNLENNQTGHKGCQFLSLANWPRLNYLGLYSNYISNEGINLLCKSNWAHLK